MLDHNLNVYFCRLGFMAHFMMKGVSILSLSTWIVEV